MKAVSINWIPVENNHLFNSYFVLRLSTIQAYTTHEGIDLNKIQGMFLYCEFLNSYSFTRITKSFRDG